MCFETSNLLEQALVCTVIVLRLNHIGKTAPFSITGNPRMKLFRNPKSLICGIGNQLCGSVNTSLGSGFPVP